MQGVGPGSVLGERYALSRRILRSADHEQWTAHDQTLERTVTALVFDASHPAAAAALDAGRRAAAIEDSRLARIFDVGRQEGVAYVIQEALTDASSLTSLLGQGGLPADEVRRIVGETAAALEVASVRGLHHQRLTPAVVLRQRDGSVKVTGLAVLAALAGDDGLTSAAASRADAVGLAALTYAALTGRWPLTSPVAEGLETAPTLGSRVAGPGEIAAGVPGDLDRLCSATLTGDGGPSTPGQFAEALAPWGVHTRWRPLDQPAVADPAEARSSVARSAAAEPAAEPAAARHAARHAAAEPTVVVGEDDGPGTAHPLGPDEDGSAADGEGHPSAGGAAAGAALAGAVSAVGSALSGTRSAAGVVGGHVGDLARAAAHHAAVAKANRLEAAGPVMTLPEALLRPNEPEEPAVPLIGATQVGPPSKGATKSVLLVLALFVLVALSLAYCNLSQLGSAGSHTSSSATTSAPAPTTSATTPSSSSSTTSSSSSSSSSSPAQAITIRSARGFDPQGDGQEMNGYAPRAFDGDPSTAWTSEGYSSERFGGLHKTGVGLLLDLGKPTTVHEITLNLPIGPTDVTVYASDSPSSITNATELASQQGALGVVTPTVASDPPKTRYVVVWFTKLVRSGGKYRVALAEISLR